jgi:hypothetical protein
MKAMGIRFASFHRMKPGLREPENLRIFRVVH